MYFAIPREAANAKEYIAAFFDQEKMCEMNESDTDCSVATVVSGGPRMTLGAFGSHFLCCICHTDTRPHQN